MSDEYDRRKEILDLLAAGKISSTAAAELLSSTHEPAQEPAGEPETIKQSVAADEGSIKMVEAYDAPSWLRVRVSDLSSGKGKVSVNIPLRLVKLGLALGSRFTPELDDLDWNQITGMLASENGMIVDVQDEEDGEHVQIYVD